LKKMSERIAELEYDRKLNAAIVQQNTELKERIAALEAVADAARNGVGLDDALDKLDALKEAGR
jgi:hypothetical protein